MRQESENMANALFDFVVVTHIKLQITFLPVCVWISFGYFHHLV